jgi:hypothetical protein
MGKEKRMLEVERADALVNAAFGRMQGIVAPIPPPDTSMRQLDAKAI